MVEYTISIGNNLPGCNRCSNCGRRCSDAEEESGVQNEIYHSDVKVSASENKSKTAKMTSGRRKRFFVVFFLKVTGFGHARALTWAEEGQ